MNFLNRIHISPLSLLEENNFKQKIMKKTLLTKILAANLLTSFAQCGNFMIFLSLRFYVKSILGILEVQNLPF